METRFQKRQKLASSGTNTGPGLNSKSGEKPTESTKASAKENYNKGRLSPRSQLKNRISAWGYRVDWESGTYIPPKDRLINYYGCWLKRESESDEKSTDPKKPKLSTDKEENKNGANSKALVVAGTSVSLPPGRRLNWNSSWSSDEFIYSGATNTVIGRKVKPTYRRNGWPFSGFVYNPTPRRAPAPSNDQDEVEVVYDNINRPYSRFRRPLRRPFPNAN